MTASKARNIKKSDASQWAPIFLLVLSSCAGMKTVMAINDSNSDSRPIENPFGQLYESPSSGLPSLARSDSLVVRTKKGERSVEFEIPSRGSEQADLELPTDSMPESQRSGDRAPASDIYASREPSVADREILWKIPKAPSDQVAAVREIELELGVKEVPSKDLGPSRSYLGRLDLVKRLYRESRFEASLLEVEEMLKDYPMDPRLHEMRGTLLDRLGHQDLARQSWKQSLEIEPSNESLRGYLEMKGIRAPASTEEGTPQ